MRPMQCTQFRAKSAKNDLKHMEFLKRNFYFKTEGLQGSSHDVMPLYSVLLLSLSPFMSV